MASLEVIGVSVRFAGLLALESVNLSISRREIVGLIGPNGAGKSTLVNVISGFQPAAGRVMMDDVDLTRLPAHRRGRIGVRRTFQNVRLFDDMTARENLVVSALGTGFRPGEANELAMEALEVFELEPIAETLAGQLSYGDERRLGIARVMVGRPKFALFDEPAAGLNEIESDRLLRLLQRTRDHYGCGIVVVEHDMRLIFRLCERIHVLDHGVTLADGGPADVRRDPKVIEAYLGSEAVT